jgi:hypothetical protein
MSTVAAAWRGALDRMAGALDAARRTSRAPARAGEEGSPPTDARRAADGGRHDDLLDRERQLRVLMSSWM